jgi:hypothetical protein
MMRVRILPDATSLVAIYPLNVVASTARLLPQHDPVEDASSVPPSVPRENGSRDYAVPSQISSTQTVSSHRSVAETSTLRCRFKKLSLSWLSADINLTTVSDTAVVDDAEDFTVKNGYDLRHRLLHRHTELIVGITYYNEDKALLCRTLHSAIEACRKFQSLKKHDFWPKAGPALQKLVICITLDGIGAADPGVLDVLAAIGVFRHGLLRKELNGKPVRTHVVRLTPPLRTDNILTRAQKV